MLKGDVFLSRQVGVKFAVGNFKSLFEKQELHFQLLIYLFDDTKLSRHCIGRIFGNLLLSLQLVLFWPVLFPLSALFFSVCFSFILCSLIQILARLSVTYKFLDQPFVEVGKLLHLFLFIRVTFIRHWIDVFYFQDLLVAIRNTTSHSHHLIQLSIILDGLETALHTLFISLAKHTFPFAMACEAR